MNQDVFNTIEKMSTRYHYSESLKTLLHKIFPEMVSYYGEQYIPQILKVIEYYPITICETGENIYTKLKEFGHIQDDDVRKTVKAEDMKRASGVASTIPAIEYENNKYISKGRSSCIILSSSFQTNDEKSITNLVHELGHALKTIENTKQIEGNQLMIRTGISVETYELSIHNGKVITKLINTYGTGLEEGINAYDEEQVMKRVTHSEFETSSYALLKKIAEILFQKPGFQETIRNAQIDGNLNQFVQNYNEISGEYEWENLIKTTDELVTLYYDSIKYIFEPEKLEETMNQEASYIPKIQACLDSYGSKLQENIQK